MAVVPMQKVEVVVHERDTDAVLSVLQRHGAFEVVEAELERQTTPEDFPYAQLLPRLQHAIQFLTPYAEKRSLWQTLREGSTYELTESDVSEVHAHADVALNIVEDLEQLQVQFADAEEQVRTLQEQLAWLKDWEALTIPLKQLSTEKTHSILVTGKVEGQLEALLQTAFESNDIVTLIQLVDETHAVVTVKRDAAVVKEARARIEALGLEVQLPLAGIETPKVEQTRIEENLAKAKSELALLHDQAEHFAHTHLRQLRITAEVLGWQQKRFTALAAAGTTAHTAVMVGWLNETKRAAIEAELSAARLAYIISDLELAEDEEPPVDIANSPFVQPFEVVTRLYGMPGYKDLDPTVFLAGFFFLFFGLSLTDVGYGITLMLVSVMILTLFKVTEIVRTFAKLLFFMGLGSALVGLVFGGYLGINPEVLPEWLRAIQLFDPIGNPLPVFYLALGLGVVQVMVGMMLKIYSEYRNGRLLEGVLDQGPWLFVFVLGILYVGVSTGYVSVITLEQIVNLIYVGLVMVVLASGRKGDTILQKVQSAALALYDSIGYFSDILSYSRLLALGLATTALAFAVNLIADIVSGSVPYLGPVLAIVVLIIGHVFTLAVNTLGAFIHSARLQFVEFFGKFISGTGKEFSPLKRTEQFVTIKKE